MNWTFTKNKSLNSFLYFQRFWNIIIHYLFANGTRALDACFFSWTISGVLDNTLHPRSDSLSSEQLKEIFFLEKIAYFEHDCFRHWTFRHVTVWYNPEMHFAIDFLLFSAVFRSCNLIFWSQLYLNILCFRIWKINNYTSKK